MKIRLLPCTHRLRTHLAFTLTEMVVAVSFLGVLFVSLFGGMSYGFATVQASRENLRATQIILERMEGLRLYNWNQVVYSNWIPASFTGYYFPLANPGESVGITYNGTMAVTNLLLPNTSYSNDMRSVVVTVRWTSAGIPRMRTLTTFIARNGMQNYIFNN
jgi:hypothetical protein